MTSINLCVEGGEEPRTAFQDVGLFRLGQPDILECRVLWQRHSDSIDELRVPVTRVGLFKLAVKRLPAPRRYVGITALSAEVRPSQEVVWEVGLSTKSFLLSFSF